jgi:anaerobic ribonucleoside-triphosphate reductase activating protein
MLKYVDTKVTFAEVPDEISLCINLSGCPHKCEGCHSSYLQEDIGTPLTTSVLDELIRESTGITCVCFMGGDNDIPQLHTLAQHVKKSHNLLTAWYTGSTLHPTLDRPICQVFDFIKTGPYIEKFGPLNNPRTNQRFYTKGSAMKKMDANSHMWYDTTDKFWTNGNI